MARGSSFGAFALILVALQLAVPLVSAQSTATTLPISPVSPSAPGPIASFAEKVISFLLFLAVAGGLAAVALGAFKFIAGGEDAGKWIGRGLIALVIALGFWAIIKFFL